MKKLIERLLVFFIGIPAIIGLVLYLPHLNNLALNLVIIFFSAMGAVELSIMLEKKQIRILKAESFILGALPPLALALNISFGLPHWIVPVIIMTGAAWALLSGVFSRQAEIGNIINKIAGGFSLIIYPGIFLFWLVKMTAWGNPGAILLFLFITFANDSAGWLFGSLFGKNNRGKIEVSPNKSIAGYIGGLFGSVIIAAGAVYLFPGVYSGAGFNVNTLLPLAVLTGVCTGIAASLGDLAESAIKRSCDLKDSGNFMLGRGGVLDSLDSIALAAPVFYMLYYFLFLG